MTPFEVLAPMVGTVLVAYAFCLAVEWVCDHV